MFEPSPPHLKSSQASTASSCCARASGPFAGCARAWLERKRGREAEPNWGTAQICSPGSGLVQVSGSKVWTTSIGVVDELLLEAWPLGFLSCHVVKRVFRSMVIPFGLDVCHCTFWKFGQDAATGAGLVWLDQGNDAFSSNPGVEASGYFHKSKKISPTCL